MCGGISSEEAVFPFRGEKFAFKTISAINCSATRPPARTRTPAPRAAGARWPAWRTRLMGKGSERASAAHLAWRVGHKARFKRGRCLPGPPHSLHTEAQLHSG